MTEKNEVQKTAELKVIIIINDEYLLKMLRADNELYLAGRIGENIAMINNVIPGNYWGEVDSNHRMIHVNAYFDNSILSKGNLLKRQLSKKGCPTTLIDHKIENNDILKAFNEVKAKLLEILKTFHQ
jgi:hypothetical protein